MELMFEKKQTYLLLNMQGRLDSATSGDAERQILERLEQEQSDWLVDLTGTAYVSSAGLRVLLLLAKRVRAAHRKLALAGLTPGVRDVFDISGFSSIFELFPDRMAAESYLCAK